MKRAILILLAMTIAHVPACDTSKKQIRTDQERKAVEDRESFKGKKEPTGGKVLTWDNFRYEGEIKNGKPHGKGVLYVLDKDGNVMKKIEGMFENGVPVGEAIVTEYDSRGR